MIHALWETGNYTFAALSKQFFISEDRIKQKSRQGKWKKGAAKPLIEQKVRERVEDILVELGMPKKELLKLLVEGAKQTLCTKTISKLHAPEGITAINPFTNAPVTYSISEDQIDNDATLRYRVELVKILGLHAAPKAPIVADSEEDPNAPSFDPGPTDKLLAHPEISDEIIRRSEGLPLPC